MPPAERAGDLDRTAREDGSMDVAAAPRSSTRRRGIRALLLLVPALAFIGLLVFGVARRPDPPRVGEPAPLFTAPRLDGNGTVSLSEFQGTPVLLNFWASWCEPCRDEASLFRRSAQQYRGLVSFVGVDVKDSRSDAIAFARRHGLDYTLVRDSGVVAPRYGLTGQPETFFIDSSGVIVEHIPGPVFEDDLYALLDVLVARDA
jgi:cytochrome c biogenesis protein CcmG, thiol:disulfide interchange protein DsbE